MTSNILAIDPVRPQSDIIEAAAATIGSGGGVIVPTGSLYGLACDAMQTDAVERIFELKNRPLEKPLLVLISHRKMLVHIVASVPPLADHLMDTFWPGKITFVMTGYKHLPRGLLSHTGKVGVRLVAHPVAAALVRAVGGPITGTSANLSGAGGCTSIDKIGPNVAAVDVILDAGPLGRGLPSTVVDVTGDLPRILRTGAVTAEEIMAAFENFTTRDHQ